MFAQLGRKHAMQKDGPAARMRDLAGRQHELARFGLGGQRRAERHKDKKTGDESAGTHKNCSSR
jgi:hypothetical protein